jgi:hypothetical protein
MTAAADLKGQARASLEAWNDAEHLLLHAKHLPHPHRAALVRLLLRTGASRDQDFAQACRDYLHGIHRAESRTTADAFGRAYTRAQDRTRELCAALGQPARFLPAADAQAQRGAA